MDAEPGTGVPPTDLADTDLDRELTHLHEKRHDILVDGSAEQWRVHVRRTDELEQEFVRRFADRVNDAGGKRA